MATPIFNFRLAPEKAKELHELARVYGAANTSVFLRELIGSIVSGDPAQVSAFNTRLFQKMGEQLALDFTAKAESAARETLKRTKTLKGSKPRKPSQQSKAGKPHRTLKPHRTHERTT